jgi:hypothetical protein
MSGRDQERISTLRRAYEAFSRGDFDTAMEIAHPEVGDKVLLHQRSWGRGASSGIEVEVDMWAVWTLDDDGLATRMESFLIHEEDKALETAGLQG